MEASYLEKLLKKYFDGLTDAQEDAELLQWYQNFHDEKVIVPADSTLEEQLIYSRLGNRLKQMIERDKLQKRVKGIDRADRHTIYGELFSGFKTSSPYLKKYAKAAAIVLVFMMVGFGVWKWSGDSHFGEKRELARRASIILPGHNGAILTLSNGKQIVLDSSANGTIGEQGNSSLLKQGATLIYGQKTALAQGGISYNTMTTPRGREFTVVLPDGTKAWLNAASSITYPTTFDQDQRLVMVTGEVYFEVAHKTDNKGRRIPFIVQMDQTKVKVLGTHFDIDGYQPTKGIKTTLLEGLVEIESTINKSIVQIHPGWQAITGTDQQIKVVKADIDKVMAWKNGLFQFDDEPLEEILQQISRWYDVDYVCQENKKILKFNGVVSKRSDVNQILGLLSVTGVVNFKIKDRKIYAY